MTSIARFFIILMLLICPAVYGQKKYEITFLPTDGYFFVKKPKQYFKDSLTAMKYIENVRYKAISKGYILASVDSIQSFSNKAVVYFYTGEKFGEISLNITQEDLFFLRKNSSISEKLISRVPFDPFSYASVFQKIQSTFLENGYPFVSLELKNIIFNDKNIEADLEIKRGPYVKWTKINIKGDSSISEKYISNVLNIKKGEFYRESEPKKITNRITQIPFLEEIKPSELLFTEEGTELFVYLKSIPISSFNGIIGFQPDPITGRLTVTGELDLKLQNVLKRGELLNIKWQSIQVQTQSLDAHFNYPFLFNTSFGIDATFQLYKRDTSFIELNSSIGVDYYLKRGAVLNVFYQNISSNILSGGLNNPTYALLGNSRSNNYGLSFKTKQFDYIPNPSKGYHILIKTSIGNRKSQINDTTPEIKSITYRGEMILEYFYPITKRHVLRIANRTEYYSAPNIFQNELYRFGGLNDQRGFNEDELLSTTKSTTSIEYRFLLDRNSHVFAFFDQSWYENNTSNYYNDTPFGFGAGFSFSTKFGVFSISYALGKQFSNPIQFSNSKIHFGYIVFF